MAKCENFARFIVAAFEFLKTKFGMDWPGDEGWKKTRGQAEQAKRPAKPGVFPTKP